MRLPKSSERLNRNQAKRLLLQETEQRSVSSEIQREMLPHRAKLEQVVEQWDTADDIDVRLRAAASVALLFPDYSPHAYEEQLLSYIQNVFSNVTLPSWKGTLPQLYNLTKTLKYLLILFPQKKDTVLPAAAIQTVWERGVQLTGDKLQKGCSSFQNDHRHVVGTSSLLAMAVPEKRAQLPIYQYKDLFLKLFSDQQREASLEKETYDDLYVSFRFLFPEAHDQFPYQKVVASYYTHLTDHQAKHDWTTTLFYAETIAQLTAEKISVDQSGFHLSYGHPHARTTSLPQRTIV